MRMISAVAYYRMSTDRQETSIADQRKAVEKYAKDNGYQILREYKDEGVSGWKKAQRRGFQLMIDDAEHGDFKAVIVWDQDRFSRFKPRTFMKYWEILDEDCGVAVVSVSKGVLDDSDFGWLLHGIDQHGKEQYCRDLAKNVVRGMREKRLAGQWFGQAPYGMKTIEKTSQDGKKQRFLAPGNADEIRIVRRIFKRRLAGLGTHLIASELNGEGIKTARGKDWKSQTIAAILERPAYVGDRLVGKYGGGGFEKVVDEPKLLRDTHEGIIDRDTFDRVQAMPIKRRNNTGRGSDGVARLRGFIFCGMCGGPMYSLKQRGGQYLYRCANYSDGTRRKDGKKCVHCAVKMKDFEQAVYDRVREVILKGSQDRLEKAIAKELKRRQRNSDGAAAEAVRARKELQKLDGQIAKASERLLLIDDDLFDGAQEQLREMKAKRERLAAATESPSKPDVSPKEIASELYRLDEICREGAAEAAREALAAIICGIVCKFEFDAERSTDKRQRYRFTGAEMVLRDNIGNAESDHCYWNSNKSKIPINVEPADLLKVG